MEWPSSSVRVIDTRTVTFFGEQAAPAVLDVVTDPASSDSAVFDGLIILRMLVETEESLSLETVARIRAAAEQRLTGRQSFLTLTRAIDLAAVLDDPALRRILEQIAGSPEEVRARGVTTPDLVERTQQRARDRLAGVPPLPRHNPEHEASASLHPVGASPLQKGGPLLRGPLRAHRSSPPSEMTSLPPWLVLLLAGTGGAFLVRR